MAGPFCPTLGNVLSLIFAHALLTARLRVLSRVCKRWRVAAFRSVKSYACYALRLDTIDHFPLLEELSFSSSKIYVALPITLRRLTIDLDVLCDLKPLFPNVPIPPLTHASFGAGLSPELMSKLSLPIMRACLTSLVSLTLSYVKVDAELIGFIKSARFPLLATLSISLNPSTFTLLDPGSKRSDAVLAFVQRHASQLTALDFSGSLPALATLHFPELRKLSLDGSRTSADVIDALLAHCPALEDLTWRHAHLLDCAASPGWFTSLTSLHWEWQVQSPLDVAPFAASARLERLSVPSAGPVHGIVASDTLRRISTHFTCDSTMSAMEAYEAWSAQPNLTHLCLEHAAPRGCDAPSSKLISLDLRGEQLAFGDAINTLQHFMTHCRALQILSARLPHASHTDAEVHELATLLGSAACTRIERLSLQCSSDDVARLPRLKAAECGWIKHVYQPY